MNPSNKRALIHYLEFLKQSGFIYADAASGSAEALLAGASVGHAAVSIAPKAPAPAPAPAASASVPVKPPIKPPVATGVALEPLTREQRIARLTDAAACAESCRACGLGAQRNRLVYGVGDPEAKIVFVGEGPGAEEDAQGEPFVGRSGQLLTKMIQAMGFQREEVYICNTVKCRPPGNRDPLPAEKDACEHFLVEQLQILSAQIVVALGAHAAQYLCRSEATIGQLRGRWHDYHGVALLATYHPAFLLRSPGMKARAWDDFKMIHAKYTDLNPADPRKLWSKE